jgi:hypothetical protein
VRWPWRRRPVTLYPYVQFGTLPYHCACGRSGSSFPPPGGVFGCDYDPDDPNAQVYLHRSSSCVYVERWFDRQDVAPIGVPPQLFA